MTDGVLLVIDNLEFGGGERGFLQIVEALGVERWRVGVAAHPGGLLEERSRAAGAAFFPLPMASRVSPASVLRLRRIVRRSRFAIVHSQGARADFVARLACLGLPRVRQVCTVQMPVEGFDVPGPRRALYVALDRLTSRRVDRFIVVSRALERALVERRGVAPDRVRLIPNGVETAAYRPEGETATAARTRLLAALRLPGEARLVGAVGRLVWQKGFEDLIEAMAGVGRRGQPAHLVIAGEGRLRGTLEESARRHGLSAAVHLVGFRKDVREVLAAVDVVAVPSRREGLPMVTLEAMALAKPIVATAIEGIVEQMDDEREALLVPPGDPPALAEAILRLLADADLGRRLGEAARRKAVAAFDVSRTVAATRRLYAALLPEGGASRGA